MEIRIRTFEALTPSELYDLLQLRSAVFVVEQECIYLDPDGKDREALHILGYREGELAAYTRAFAPGAYMDQASIGRVSVRESHRGLGLAKEIMVATMEAVEHTFGAAEIALSAQSYLKRFYTELGYQAVGEEYLEDGIPHIKMIRQQPS